MSLGMQRKFGAEKRGEEILKMDPRKVLLTSDKDHPLYDERAATAPPKWFVNGIRKTGWKSVPPIEIRYSGTDEAGAPIVHVVNGRQRVQAARIINEEDGLEGKDYILAKAVVWEGTDSEAADAVIRFNEGRVRDSLPVRIAKAKRRLDAGRDRVDVAEMFGVSLKTLDKWMTVNDMAPALAEAVMSEAVSLEVAIPLAKLPREAQGKALEELREEGKATGPRAKQAAVSKASRGQEKAPQKRSRKYAELEAKRTEALKTMKPGRFRDGYVAALAFAQGEEETTEDAAGGE